MIYFDAGATTLQKPEAVARAMYRAVGTLSSPGRGSYPATRAAEETDLRCRTLAAELFGVTDPERVVFTSSATHGLNVAVRTLVRPGGTVLLSGWEHNAVTRPLAAVPGAVVRTVRAPLFRPEAFLEDLDRQLREDPPDAVFLTQVSNVFGYVLPVAEAAALCRARGVPLAVDASQAAGVLPVELADWGARFVAMPGHKGLYGPQGTGLLLCGGEAEPVLLGGTGSASRLAEMPEFLPDRLEAGTHNVPGAAGLLEGLRFVRQKGPAALLRHETALKDLAAGELAKLPGVEVFHSAQHQSGVLSFRVAGRDVGEVADRLAQGGIAVRAGLHCAPLAHQSGGTGRTGTVRVSFSAFNSQKEVERFVRVLRQMA